MKKARSTTFTISLLLTAGLWVCGTTGGEDPVTSPEDMLAFSRTMVTLDRLASEADIIGLVDRFAEDAVVMPPGEPTILGRRAIRSRAAKLLADRSLDIRHEPLEVDAAGAYLIHRGILHVRGAGEAATPELDLRYLYVLKRGDGDSLLVWRALFNRGPV